MGDEILLLTLSSDLFGTLTSLPSIIFIIIWIIVIIIHFIISGSMSLNGKEIFAGTLLIIGLAWQLYGYLFSLFTNLPFYIITWIICFLGVTGIATNEDVAVVPAIIISIFNLHSFGFSLISYWIPHYIAISAVLWGVSIINFVIFIILLADVDKMSVNIAFSIYITGLLLILSILFHNLFYESLLSIFISYQITSTLICIIGFYVSTEIFIFWMKKNETKFVNDREIFSNIAIFLSFGFQIFGYVSLLFFQSLFFIAVWSLIFISNLIGISLHSRSKITILFTCNSFLISLMIFNTFPINAMILVILLVLIDIFSIISIFAFRFLTKKVKEQEQEQLLKLGKETEEIKEKQNREKKIEENAKKILQFISKNSREPTKVEIFADLNINIDEIDEVRDWINKPVKLDPDLNLDEVQSQKITALNDIVKECMVKISKGKPFSLETLVSDCSQSIEQAKYIMLYVNKLLEHQLTPASISELEKFDPLAGQLLGKIREKENLDIIECAKEFNVSIYEIKRAAQFLDELKKVKLNWETDVRDKEEIERLSREIVRSIKEKPSLTYHDFAVKYGPYTAKKAFLYLEKYVPEILRPEFMLKEGIQVLAPKLSSTTVQLAYPEDFSNQLSIKGINILRGGEIMGGKSVFKIKIDNKTNYIINDVVFQLVSYPSDCLQLVGSETRKITKISIDGFVSPSFEFQPTKDCVKGKIHASLSYLDHQDQLHVSKIEPHEILMVCGLLTPKKIDGNTFMKITEKILDFEKAGEDVTIPFNAKLLFQKLKVLLPDHNFEFVIHPEEKIIGSTFIGEFKGFAEGKFSKKEVGIKITVTGNVDQQSSIAKIESFCQDAGMLSPLIYELGNSMKEKIEDSNECVMVLELAKDKGWINVEELVRKKKWDLKRAKKVLSNLEKEKIAKKIESPSEGTKWYFPGLIV